MREYVSVHTSDDQPGIATLLLSRPPSNALTRQLYREIVSAAADLGQREDICAVIVFGGHEIFSAGDDMPELDTLSIDEAEVAARVCREAVDALAALPKPTVAAITGYALGGGLNLALAADWRVAGDNVKFGATEILAGRVPQGGTAGTVVPAMVDLISSQIDQHGADNVGVYGDSLGGTIGLAAVQELVLRGDPVPSHMVLK